MRDLPSISGSTYTSNVVGMAQMMANQGTGLGIQAGLANQFRQQQQLTPTFTANPASRETYTMTTRRLVQVFIADPNENVPLDQSMLYSGEQKLTDATDQELFFEIDIKNILDKHNEKRTKLVDKKIKERTEHLEPAKIRDLKMVVVTVAGF